VSKLFNVFFLTTCIWNFGFNQFDDDQNENNDEEEKERKTRREN